MIVEDHLRKLEDDIAGINQRLMNIRRTSVGGGEANTASNQGAGGVGVYDAKVGVDLQFRNINAASAKIDVSLDAGNKEIDIDVVPAQIDLSDLGAKILPDLDDVVIAAPANGQVLAYVDPPGQWENTAAGAGDVTAAANLGDDYITRGDGGAKGIQDSLLYLTDAGLLCLNETVNTKMDIGLTIHQGEHVTEIVSLKGTNINHGITGVTETNTFLLIMQTSAGGGAYFYALEESGANIGAPGASLRCYTKTSRTEHTNIGHATMMAYGAYCGGGTNRTTAPAGFNVFAIRTYDSAASWKSLHIWAEDGEQFIWGINPKIFINETTNAKMTIGITVHQGSASNEIQAGKASNINHGITSRAETDTFYKFQQVNVNYGGLNIEAYQEISGTGPCLNLGAYTKTDKHGTLGPTNVPTINLQAVYCGGGTDRMPAPAGFVLGSWSTYDSTGNWRHKWQINQEGNTWQLGGALFGGNVKIGATANPVDSLLHVEGGYFTLQGAGTSAQILMKDADGNLDGTVHAGGGYVGFKDADEDWTVQARKDQWVKLFVNNLEGFKLGVDLHIDIYDWDDAVLREVSFGPDDSGDPGFKVLQVAN